MSTKILCFLIYTLGITSITSASELMQVKSKWLSKALTKEECQIALTEIKNKQLELAPIPEILSAIDIINFECSASENQVDPQIVVQDQIPFSIQGSPLYFEWNQDKKLIVKTNHVSKKDDYVIQYNLTNLTQGDQALIEAQKNAHKNHDLLPEVKDKQPTANVKSWWQKSKSLIEKIAKEGETEIYLPFYAYHDRRTYDAEQIAELNEHAYGIGAGKSIINENGNTEKIYAIVHLDSHFQVETEVGYGWEKNFILGNKVRAGVGYGAGLVSREDIYNRIPIPFILPTASITYDRASLNTVIIPSMGGVNHGNVVFLYGKYTFEKMPE